MFILNFIDTFIGFYSWKKFINWYFSWTRDSKSFRTIFCIEQYLNKKSKKCKKQIKSHAPLEKSQSKESLQKLSSSQNDLVEKKFPCQKLTLNLKDLVPDCSKKSSDNYNNVYVEDMQANG